MIIRDSKSSSFIIIKIFDLDFFSVNLFEKTPLTVGFEKKHKYKFYTGE
jgi:hypothetical protein